jgi:hypothetical protein
MLGILLTCNVLLLCMLAKGPVHSRDTLLPGTFGKPLRRPQLEACSSYGQSPDCQSRALHMKAPSVPDLDLESEEDEKGRTDFQEDNYTCTYKQNLENYRTQNFQSYNLDT